MYNPLQDPLFVVMLLLRYAHILGAMTLFGATVFMRFALAPSAESLPADAHTKLKDDVRAKWAKFVHLSILLLLVSGVTNMALASRFKFGAGEVNYGMLYNMLVGVKLLLALPIFFIASVLAGRSEGTKKFRASAPFWMNINIVLAIVMVLMGGFLRFVPRQLKGEPPAAVRAETTP